MDRTASWAGLPLHRPLVMGILNITPDSFSDGGLHANPVAAGQAMLAAGADVLDIGGESTRPGAQPVPPETEIARIIPVIRVLARDGAVISADTRNAATMAAALDAGARIINDVSGLNHDPAARKLVAARGCPVVLMHSRGTPADMNARAEYADVVEEVLAELIATRDAAVRAGIGPEKIALDPGIGFAKLGQQNIALLGSTARFARLGHPLLIGVSRKKFIGELAQQQDPKQRGPGSIAAGLYAVARGAHILRVHDVPATVQALRVWMRLIAGDDGAEN